MTPAVLCSGDCNQDNVVTIDEVILAINIVLGEAKLDRCAHLDVNGDHLVTVDEVIRAATQALDGCPPATALDLGL